MCQLSFVSTLRPPTKIFRMAGFEGCSSTGNAGKENRLAVCGGGAISFGNAQRTSTYT